MAAGKNGDNENFFIKLEGALSAYEVANIKPKLIDGLEKNSGITIDLQDITECDTLGIQLICSAAKTAKLQNKDFSISTKSELCWTAAQNIGLDLEPYLNT